MPIVAGESRLALCHSDLQRLVRTVARTWDVAVLPSTIRTLDDQRRFVAEGKSRTMQSKHLPQSDGLVHAIDMAMDAVPDGKPSAIDWQDTMRFCYFGGYVVATAHALGITNIVWGNDWNMDTNLKDTTFRDMVHFELR